MHPAITERYINMSRHTTCEFSDLVSAELKKARKEHGNISSYHEGLAVIQEEFEEFKDEVYRKEVDIAALEKELVQLACTCRRFYEDLQENK